jgi:hypothetical protein
VSLSVYLFICLSVYLNVPLIIHFGKGRSPICLCGVGLDDDNAENIGEYDEFTYTLDVAAVRARKPANEVPIFGKQLAESFIFG